MKLLIGGREIVLNKKEVAIARASVDNFLEAFEEKTKELGMSQYLTAIIYMYVKSSKLLDGIGLENLDVAMQLFNKEKEG